MPADIFEDLFHFDAPVAATVPQDPSDNPTHPLPHLTLAGRRETVSIRTATLENQFLRVLIALDLGGRIFQILDKRTGIDVLPRSTKLELLAGGPRGLYSPTGITWMGDSAERRNGLGAVEHLLRPAMDDELPATLVLHDFVPGIGLSMVLEISLPPDRSEIAVSYRALNRTFVDVPYQPGLALPELDGKFEGTSDKLCAYYPSRDAGLIVRSDPGTFEALEVQFAQARLHRVSESGSTLAPRISDHFQFVIQPFSGIGRPLCAEPEFIIGMRDQELGIACSQQRESDKVFLHTRDGQTLEASIEPAGNASPVRMKLEGIAIDPAAIAIRDANHSVLLRWSKDQERSALLPKPAAMNNRPISTRRALLDQAYALNLEGQLCAELARRASHDPVLRVAAWTLIAYEAMRDEDYPAAKSALETALLYQGDDWVLWALHGIVSRLETTEELAEEAPGLLNAHYLNPLEPLLRAEAFLSQPQTHGSEASPLVTPIANHPEALIEVACQLLEGGLRMEASRWIDECLRHRPVRSLLVLAGDALRQSSRMQAESETFLARARALSDAVPLPWRPYEITAFRRAGIEA